MSAKLLVLRPEPGASETAARARAMGLEPVVAPLFFIRPLAWTAPDPSRFDAVMLTSGNAARHGGSGLEPFLSLPGYAVGEATAAAARARGFSDVRVGPEDAAALLSMMAEDRMGSAFHPCGRDHADLSSANVAVHAVPVYAAEAVERLPAAAAAALAEGALALLHSPRAAAMFAGLVRNRKQAALAAISPDAAKAAGGGWRSVAVAPRPRDEALLELAAKLCHTGRR